MTDTLAANKELVRRLYEQGFNAGDLDVVDQLVSRDVVTHNPIILDAPTGPDSIRGGIEMLRRSFPDLHVEVLELIAEGDRVAAFLRMSGTNTGDYRRGAPPTGAGACELSSSGAWPTVAWSRARVSRTASSCSNSSGSSPQTTSWPRRCPSRKSPLNVPTQRIKGSASFARYVP